MTQAVHPRVRVRRRALTERRVRGWSEGDAWTVGIGLVVALALAASTIPPVLDARSALRHGAPRPAGAAPAPVARAGAPVAVPAPTVAPPVVPPLIGPLTPAIPPAGTPLAAFTEPPSGRPAAPRLQAGAVRVFAALMGGDTPGGLVAAPDGAVSAGTDVPDASAASASHLFSWDALGALRDSSEVPEQPATRARGLTALGRLPDGALVATDASTARILRYDGAWSVLARLPDLAPCILPTATPCQPGIEDTAPLPRGVAVDVTGDVFVADAGQGTVWQLRPGKPIQVWYQSADIAGDDGIAGMAFDANGDLLAVTTSLFGVIGPGAGALLRIERRTDGSAGARSVLSGFKAGEDPVDVAVGASGNLYVPLRGANALVVLDARGVESLRVVEDVLKNPTAVELVAGRALVTTTSPRRAVLEVGVIDRPVTPRT